MIFGVVCVFSQYQVFVDIEMFKLFSRYPIQTNHTIKLVDLYFPNELGSCGNIKNDETLRVDFERKIGGPKATLNT